MSYRELSKSTNTEMVILAGVKFDDFTWYYMKIVWCLVILRLFSIIPLHIVYIIIIANLYFCGCDEKATKGTKMHLSKITSYTVVYRSW